MIDKSKQIIDIFTKKLPNIFQKNDIRKNQVQMGLDVSDFLFNESKQIMFVEAPVGTGKSLGLLIPGSIYSNHKNKTIIYSTATINLQNQIFEKDSIILSKLGLIYEDEKIVAQGKGNYTCQSVFEDNKEYFSNEQISSIEKFFKSCKFGLFSELEKNYPDLNLTSKQKNALSMQNSQSCPPYKHCPSHEHRRSYNSFVNKLIITNHDQLIQSYINVQNIEIRKPIINYDDSILIIDEAHFFKEKYLSRTVDSFSLKELEKIYRVVPSKLKAKYKALTQSLKLIEKKLLKEGESKSNHNISQETLDILKQIHEILWKTLLKDASQKYSNPNITLTEKIHEQLKVLLSSTTRSWYQFDKTLFFQSVSLDFNKNFTKMICELSRYSKIIFMSGTLTTDEPIADLQRDWGLAKSRFLYKSYSSIFDFGKQSLIYVPKSLSHPSNPKHLSQIKAILPELLNSFSGGSLILCTSNSYMEEIHSYLVESKIFTQNILCQNKKGAKQIYDEFTKDTDSILVGSGAYFTGFSVEGPALNKLFLTKLPFPVKDDPYIDLISDGIEKKRYEKFILPSMLTQLEQGLGRLIRSQNDFGYITIFDYRIFKTPEIKRFLEKLGYRITQNIQEVYSFMNDLEENGVELKQVPFSETQLIIPRSHLTAKSKRLPIYSYGLLNTRKHSISTKQLKENDAINSRYLRGLNLWLDWFISTYKPKHIPFMIDREELTTPADFYQVATNLCYLVGIYDEILEKSFPFNSLFTSKEKEEFYNIKPTKRKK